MRTIKTLIVDAWYRYIAAPLWQLKRRIILLRDRGRCRYCQEELTPRTFTVDHVIPRCAGGSDAFKNLIACCKYCNKLKGDRAVTPDLRNEMWIRAFQRAKQNSAEKRKLVRSA